MASGGPSETTGSRRGLNCRSLGGITRSSPAGPSDMLAQRRAQSQDNSRIPGTSASHREEIVTRIWCCLGANTQLSPLFDQGPVVTVTDVVVVGAGAAGIAAARTIRDARRSVALVEARDRLGGRAWTYQYGAHGLDLGAGHLHSADENDWARIAPDLGFTVDVRPPAWARPAYAANFALSEQEDYWVAMARLYARFDA